MQTRASHVPLSLVSPGECPPTTEGGLTNGVIRPTSDSATGQQGVTTALVVVKKCVWAPAGLHGNSETTPTTAGQRCFFFVCNDVNHHLAREGGTA